MDDLFNYDQNYNIAAITTIFYDAYPDRYSNYNSCFMSISGRATKLEKKGIISSVNKQKRNRIYSGADATRIVSEVLTHGIKRKTPFKDLSKSFLEDLSQKDNNDISGWLGVAERTRVNDGILISINKAHERKNRIVIRFDEISYRGIFGRGNDAKKASVYISKKNPNNFFIVPEDLEGVQSWTVTNTGNCYKFSFSADGPYLTFFNSFLGGYNLTDLILTGITAPNGEPVKAWGFKAKDA